MICTGTPLGLGIASFAVRAEIVLRIEDPCRVLRQLIEPSLEGLSLLPDERVDSVPKEAFGSGMEVAIAA